MALYFTLAIECYGEADAARIAKQLEAVGPPYRHPPNSNGCCPYACEGWHVVRDGLNDPEIIAKIIDQCYLEVSSERGIRRALCGYEAQDAFEDGDGDPDLDCFDLPDLIYDRAAATPEIGA